MATRSHSMTRAVREPVTAPTTARGRRTRQRLLDAAREVFAGTSFDGTRITDITERASVSTGTFYRYFETKEEIFGHVAEDVLAEMAAASRRRADDPDDTVSAIAASTRRYFDVCIANATIARSMEHLASRDDTIASARRSTVISGVERSRRWIEQLQAERGSARSVDAWATAVVLHTMTVRVAYDHLMHDHGADDLDRMVDAVTAVWANAVGLGPGDS